MLSKIEIVSLLQSLGTNANEIAENLMALGIKGHRGSITQDPLSNFLRSKFQNPASSGISSIYVNEIRIYFYENGLEELGQFAVNFEYKYYPEIDVNYYLIP